MIFTAKEVPATCVGITPPDVFVMVNDDCAPGLTVKVEDAKAVVNAPDEAVTLRDVPAIVGVTATPST